MNSLLIIGNGFFVTDMQTMIERISQYFALYKIEWIIGANRLQWDIYDNGKSVCKTVCFKKEKMSGMKQISFSIEYFNCLPRKRKLAKYLLYISNFCPGENAILCDQSYSFDTIISRNDSLEKIENYIADKWSLISCLT